MLVAWLVLLGGPQAALGAYDGQVEAVQARLTELGYDPGPVDGLIGRRTRKALRAFQDEEGLDASGRVDEPTLIALRLREAPPLEAASPEPQAEPAAESQAEPAAESQAEPAAESQAEPAAESQAEPAAEPQAEPAAEPRAEPAAETEAEPAVEPQAEPAVETEAEEPPAPTDPPPPAPASRPSLLTYRELGWPDPESGESALRRFRASGDSPIRGRLTGELVVPGGDRVYVLERGEHIPGLQCDPAAGILSVELMFDLEGPMLFTSHDERGLCRLGFGVVLMLDSTLYLEEATWADTVLPAGKVRLVPRGLEYLSYE